MATCVSAGISNLTKTSGKRRVVPYPAIPAGKVVPLTEYILARTGIDGRADDLFDWRDGDFTRIMREIPQTGQEVVFGVLRSDVGKFEALCDLPDDLAVAFIPPIFNLPAGRVVGSKETIAKIGEMIVSIRAMSEALLACIVKS